MEAAAVRLAQLRQRQRQRQQQEDEEQIRQRQRQHEDGRVQREDEIFRALLAQAQQHGLLGTHPPTGHRPLPPDAELPDFAEVMQASQEAIRNARRSCEQWLRRNIPEKWQRRFSVWLLHAKVASPNLKLMLQRGWRRIAAVFGLPDSLPDLPSKIPTPLLISLALMYLRFPGALLKHLLGLAYLSFVASLLIWEDCDICCETCSTAFMVTNSCGHRCCRRCLSTFLETERQEKVTRMRHARAYTIRCFGGCDARLDQSLAFVGSEELRPFLEELKRRSALISRCPPGSQWVECPQMSCVGVGYRGQQRVMCFMCEHQWEDPEFGLGRRLWNWMKNTLFPDRIDGIDYRCCPHCGTAIVKRGGCDNMRCSMCDGIFRWGPFANTLEGVVAQHAPPSTRATQH